MVAPHTVDLGRPAELSDLLKIVREADSRAEALPEAVTAVPSVEPRAEAAPSTLPPIPAPPPAALFDRSRLYAGLPGRCTRYEMPGGGAVYVHPPSAADVLWAERQSVRQMKAYFDGDGQLRKGLEAEFVAEANTRRTVWLALAVCRAGESLADARIFTDADNEAFFANPAWYTAAEEIVAHSRALTTGESEAAALRKALALFFDSMAEWLRTTVAPSVTDEPTSSALLDFANCASSKKPWEQVAMDLSRVMGGS
jgi:hypothetical protein